ncbi:hypothetical protein [Candidatus Nitrososphaera evergladensis]|uniref:hypothetical protein n=1 Tax=Candidatus Nitrososphaera evergladensis TaxID=1459637 RepID=UPI0011E5B98F|nr:hypothetical protein [Candidatus Nitrososphaera evergladensis]
MANRVIDALGHPDKIKIIVINKHVEIGPREANLEISKASFMILFWLDDNVSRRLERHSIKNREWDGGVHDAGRKFGRAGRQDTHYLEHFKDRSPVR